MPFVVGQRPAELSTCCAEKNAPAAVGVLATGAFPCGAGADAAKRLVWERLSRTRLRSDRPDGFLVVAEEREPVRAVGESHFATARSTLHVGLHDWR